jgi:hypothetical protein
MLNIARLMGGIAVDTPISDQCPEFAESVWLAQAREQRRALVQQEEINKQLHELQATCLGILATIQEMLGRIENV